MKLASWSWSSPWSTHSTSIFLLVSIQISLSCFCCELILPDTVENTRTAVKWAVLYTAVTLFFPYRDSPIPQLPQQSWLHFHLPSLSSPNATALPNLPREISTESARLRCMLRLQGAPKWYEDCFEVFFPFCLQEIWVLSQFHLSANIIIRGNCCCCPNVQGGDRKKKKNIQQRRERRLEYSHNIFL